MNIFTVPLLSAVAVTVFGQTLYHVMAKGASPRSPFELIFVAYLTGLIVITIAGIAVNRIAFSAILAPETLFRGTLLGVAVSLVELGYMFAYRAGLPINIGGISILALTTVFLVPFGHVLFSEAITLRLVAGCAVTTWGLWMMLGR